jgi:cytochrome c oxidase subunit 3
MSQQALRIDQRHPYHLVDPSPWPLVCSFGALTMTFGGVMWFHSYSGGGYALLTGMLTVIFTMYVWWRDIVREATFEGQHTDMVQTGMRMGMILFIASEVMFFFGFFWAFFHAALVPVQEIGCVWPPQGVEVFNAWEVPLLNTVILLSSGATCTWAHDAIVAGDRRSAILALVFTLLLAFLFTGFQVLLCPMVFMDLVSSWQLDSMDSMYKLVQYSFLFVLLD